MTSYAIPDDVSILHILSGCLVRGAIDAVNMQVQGGQRLLDVVFQQERSGYVYRKDDTIVVLLYNYS